MSTPLVSQYVVLDTESFLHSATKQRRLLALAFVVLQPHTGDTTHQQNTVLVQWPETLTIDAASFDVHAISVKQAADEGVPMAEVLQLLCTHLTTDCVLVGHGVQQDCQLLLSEALLLNNHTLVQKLTNTPMVCTKLCMQYPCRLPGPIPSICKWPSLTEAYDFVSQFGYTADTELLPHDPYSDVQQCLSILRYILHTYPGLLP
jgi:hypothetical protein